MISVDIYFYYSYQKNFLETQNRVRIRHGKRAIGVRVIEVLLNLYLWIFSFTCIKDFWARGYKTFFMLNSAEHEIFSANKCENAKNSWHFHIY